MIPSYEAKGYLHFFLLFLGLFGKEKEMEWGKEGGVNG